MFAEKSSYPSLPLQKNQMVAQETVSRSFLFNLSFMCRTGEVYVLLVYKYDISYVLLVNKQLTYQ